MDDRARLIAQLQGQPTRPHAFARAPVPSLDDRAYGLLGADPTLGYRGTILPMGRTAEGDLTLAWPQFAIDTARSVALPRHAAEGGEFSVDDVTRMGMDVGMLGSVASVPRGAMRMGGGMVDDAQQGVIRLTDDAAARLSPEERLRIAQHNAAQPVEAGGLGLPPDNTPQMRAQAMGFDTDAYHGTDRNISEFDLSRAGENDQGFFGRGLYTHEDPEWASAYSRYRQDGKSQDAGLPHPGANVLPVKVRGKMLEWPKSAQPYSTPEEAARATQDMTALGYDGVSVPFVDFDGARGPGELVTFDPRNIRSRFAAFDPARSASANLLAANTATPLQRLYAMMQSHDNATRDRVARETLARGGT